MTVTESIRLLADKWALDDDYTFDKLISDIATVAEEEKRNAVIAEQDRCKTLANEKIAFLKGLTPEIQGPVRDTLLTAIATINDMIKILFPKTPERKPS